MKKQFSPRCTDRNKEYVTFCTQYDTDDCKYTCGYAVGMELDRTQRASLRELVEVEQ